ncbi:hypothetical protein [Aneurinibacillus sp. REN35]|uniref:hypothetical protein n=1 Tax=Aneurinibacillus sp. REN35 TaxID=3237286 RepID=UPI00352999C5
MKIEWLEPYGYEKHYTAKITDESGCTRNFCFSRDVPKERALKMLPTLIGDGRRKPRK